MMGATSTRGLTAFTVDASGRPFELWFSERQIERLGGRARATTCAATVLAQEIARFSCFNDEAKT